MPAYNEQVTALREQWRRDHIENYEAPVVEDVIVGFSGIDPDKKTMGKQVQNDISDFVKKNIQALTEDAVKELVKQAIEDNNTGGGAGIPDDAVASDQEFNEMLDEVFPEAAPDNKPDDKPDENPDDKPDDKPDGKSDGIPDDKVATDQEFNEMLDEIFN